MTVVGTRIGYLEIVKHRKRSDTYVATCRCGETVILSAMQARHGSVHACPTCLAEHFPAKRRDITGRKYGILKVCYPEQSEGKYTTRWVCECEHCHTQSVQLAKDLTGGTQIACPNCGSGGEADMADIGFSLARQRIGALTVHYHPAGQRTCLPGNDDWLCRCDCGTFVTYSRADLLLHGARDCGCSRHAQPHRIAV